MSEKSTWDNYPKGIIGWILWSIPPKMWKFTIWVIGAFIALTAIVAFYQLSNLRTSQLGNLRTKIFEEQWNLSESSVWKSAIIQNWSKPEEIPDKIWRGASEHPDPRIRISVASHSWVPSPIKKDLLDDKDLRVRLLAILNRKNNRNILKLLSRDSSKKVRSILASNLSTPRNLLVVLANDKDVWNKVAGNEAVPSDTLRALSKMEDTAVLRAVAMNKNTPPD
jgi:hypothetical protein